jgi:CelD/BcsL family acetyltransferase involved in cellulose biosynthesis
VDIDSKQTIEISLIDDPRDFEAMEEEWNELYRNAPLATPFQSWAWLYSWWEFYGEGCQLRIIAVRDGHLLVGLAPLMLERRWGLGRLLFVGVRATGPTDYLDILVRQGWEDGVSEAVVRSLREMGSWQVADLQELRPAAAAWNVFRRWDGPRIHSRKSNSIVVEAEPWDELLMSLPRKARYDIRRALRRAEADGVRCQPARPAEAEQAARRLVVLNREQWQERGVAPEALTRTFEAHLEVTARRMTDCGLGGIFEFWRDGEVIASHFLVFGHDYVGEYMVGSGREALRRYQVSSLYVHDGVSVARTQNSTRLDLGRGEEAYKLRWASEVVPNHLIILGRSWVFWALYTGYRSLRLQLRRYAESESTPEWIKNFLERLRGR